ncbi:MAG: hypothetical protein SFY68_06060 [Candidatus Sumerlaeia bacterium]|nr:hypothetical protein [Candidatus Sumerlaeia bacterium]
MMLKTIPSAQATLLSRLILLATPLFWSVVGAESPTANIVVYDRDFKGQERARVVASRLVNGYTIGGGPYDGNSLNVSRLSPTSEGFVPMGSVDVNLTLPGNPLDYFIYFNQTSSTEAHAWFGEVGVEDPLRVEVDPPSGKFQVPQRLSFYTPDAGTVISYSLNGGPFNPWDGKPLLLSKDSSLQYRGILGNIQGPVKVATYDIEVPLCADSDGDSLPDGIEIALGLNPLSADADFNGNTLDDFDEYLRGANSFLPNTPNSLPPDWVDADGDTWTAFDEKLRGTQDNDPLSQPAAPNLQTVELFRSGTIEELAIGGTGVPPAPEPGKPWPTIFEVEVLNPSGIPLSPPNETINNSYQYRTSGEQFHLIRARAMDGSGRILLAVEPPKGLCIDPQGLCNSATIPAAWRAAYLAEYSNAIFHSTANNRVDARTTAEAFLLNRYYELEGEAEYLPGVENKGPSQELVQVLRASRNESELYLEIQNAVTPAMIDLVSDYLRFYTSPGDRTMINLLADHFAGRVVEPTLIPAGVRQANIAIVAAETTQFLGNLPPAKTVLTGTLSLNDFGFLLQVEEEVYRLQSYIEAWPEGTIVTVETIINREGCNLNPIPALVTNILEVELPPLAEEIDSDNDNLGDDWEFFYFGDLQQGAQDDADNDGVNNEDEFNDGTNPNEQAQQIAAKDAWVFF